MNNRDRAYHEAHLRRGRKSEGERVKGEREKDQVKERYQGANGTTNPTRALPCPSCHRVDMHLRYRISGTKQVGLARRVDFERPQVCNACTWHSPYLLYMASTSNSMNLPSACPLLLVAPRMTLADLQA